MKKILIYYIFICFAFSLSAQSPYPFGTVSRADLEMTAYEPDKEAPAVYLFDWGEARIDITASKPLTLTKHFRIKILNARGLDYASFKLVYTVNRLPKFKASTFNLEDGNIVETPLNNKDIYVERKTPSTYSINFAFNNVRIGSVIECTYTLYLESIFQLYPWAFQQRIPVASSEFSAIYPGVFNYKYELHKNALSINMARSSVNMRLGNIQTQEVTQKFTGTNLPAFEPETYMTSENDQLARVEFELGRIDLNNYYNYVTPTYAQLSKDLLDDDNFGGPIEHSQFLQKSVSKITAGLTDDFDKIRAIHKYITDNVKWNEENGIYTTSQSFKKVLANQNGSAADINLLLVAMLQKAGITAHPVVFSTRENGQLNKIYAIKSKFDYVVAYVKINNNEYMIDTTDALRPYNLLPFECLNGDGRLVHERASEWLPLHNNEQFFDQVILDLTAGNEEYLQGNVQRIYSSYSAYNIRKTIQSIGKEGYWEFLKQKHANWTYTDLKITNLDTIEKPLIISYTLKVPDVVQQSSDLLIINPVLFFAHNENPFPVQERKFPIDFGCPENEIYTLNFKVPDGYIIDETPANTNLKMPEDALIFIYQVEQNANMVSIKYRYNRKKSFFEAEDYTNLREFFNKMIRKQSELIILKKQDTPVAKNNN